MTDSEIMDLYQKRDEAAIRETQKKYQRYLMKIAVSILGDESDAEECLNDALLAAWNSVPADWPEHLSLYLGKIVRAKAIDRVRYNTRQKRQPSEYTVSVEELWEVFADDHSPEDALDDELLREALQRFLQKQSAGVRTLFLARYFYYRSLREAAALCEISESKAKSILFRTRKKLRTFLKKEGFTP